MKAILFLLLGVRLMGEPLWIPKGYPVPLGLIRVQLNSPTQSMAPAMTGKEVCYMEPYGGGQVPVGEFVWFVRWDGAQVLHRVTASNKRAVLTSGDNNRVSDGWTPNNKIRFVLRYVERQPVSYLAQVR